MHLITSLIHLSIAIALGGNPVKAADSGYIVTELPSISCQSLSSDDACSSLDYKIPVSKLLPDLSEIREKVPTVAKAFRSTRREACSQSGTKYYCSIAYPFRCEGDYVKVDVKKIEAMCNTGKSDCSTLDATILNSVFNCSGIASKLGGQQQMKVKFTCDAFPEVKNDPYKCVVDYKVFAENKTTLQLATKEISFAHKMLKKYSNITDDKCETSLADAVCKAAIPACSKDRTKLVSILSKQDCYKTVGCVNKTKNAELIEGAHKMCQNLPDSGKAKKISLDNVYDGKAANNVMAFSTTLMIALVVAQRFI